MAFDLASAIGGGVIVMLVAVIGLAILFGLIFSKVKEQLKYLLTKLYARTSLMIIAMMDIAAAFVDPTQTLLGLGVAPIAAVLVFMSEWGLAHKFERKWTTIGMALFTGMLAGAIVAIPFPIAGTLVAWFGVVGDKKKK